MKILFISKDFSGSGLCLRLHREGNEVRAFVEDPLYGQVLDGLVEKVASLDNGFAWVGRDGLLVFTNQSRVESKGIGLLAKGKRENGYSGRLSYSYQDTKNLGSSLPVANSPHSMVKGALTAPLPLKKSFATLETTYTGSRLNASREKVAGDAVFNLTPLNRDLLKGLDLSASVYNLFDTRYAAPSGPEHVNSLGEALREITQDGITFRIKATFRF